jgi:Dyp-type peroxidase family
MKQNGIYFDKHQTPGRSFSIVFLRIRKSSRPADIGNALKSIWSGLQDLKKGRTQDVGRNWKKQPCKGLTCLMGYGRKTFHLAEKSRLIPSVFQEENLPDFNRPKKGKPVPIWNESGLMYNSNIIYNGADADVAIQFISDIESDTKLAALETWKNVFDADKLGSKSLYLSGYYCGFHRNDNRNMLDFFDGISNIRSEDREKFIFNGKSVDSPNERIWINDSTYMAFLRILIDIRKWRNLGPKKQEEIVGRHKITGCPIVYKKNDTKIISKCPAAGTTNISDSKNKIFWEYDPKKSKNIQEDYGFSLSHMGRVRKADNQQIRIFRQGYDFFERTENSPYFNIGLNFVSFQKEPRRLHYILTQRKWMGGVSIGGQNNKRNPSNVIFTVEAAGLFFVPPLNKGKFPGAEIFS